LRRLAFALLHVGPLEPWVRRLSLLVSLSVWPRVLGMRHAPRRGGLLVTAGHVSGSDVPLVSSAVPRTLELVVDERFLKVPVLRIQCAFRGTHPLSPTDGSVNLATMRRVVERLKRKVPVLIFPQGFGQAVGAGTAVLAARAGVPVLPVFVYRVTATRAQRRALAVVRRPLPPPATDAASRQRFMDRLERRMRAMGSLRARGGMQNALDAGLDDPDLWRDPLRVIRRAARIPRLPADRMRRLERRARWLLRACGRIRCSVGDLRRPAGLGTSLGHVALLPLALAGLALCSVPLLGLRLATRLIPDAGDRRTTRIEFGPILAGPWGVFLALFGCMLWGPPGLALPVVALAGLLADAYARKLRRSWSCGMRARRQRPRLQRMLDAFDRELP